jgi:hypothetical protein
MMNTPKTGLLAAGVALLAACGTAPGTSSGTGSEETSRSSAAVSAPLASDQVTAAALAGKRPHSGEGRSNPNRPASNPLQGIDSVANFTGQFTAAGVDAAGNPSTTWSYAMVGNAPAAGGTTRIHAPVIPVSIDLRNADGTPRYVNGVRLFYDATQFVQPTLESPIFEEFRYSSSERPTQFNDAVHRAQFWGTGRHGRLPDDWHTILEPRVRQARTMVLNAGSYQFALNDDGTCCKFILVDENAFQAAFFPPSTPDGTTVIGAAEVAGDITTKDISTFLFPNTFLWENGDPTQCCVLGFHSFDSEAGDAKNGNLPRFYVMNYSSWISPGLFGSSFSDITAISHELAETFADPFVVFDGVHNLTPWWLAPNGNCQDNLEVGDVIEGLPNATYPITMQSCSSGPTTYHPQNEALLSWFEGQSPSTAIGGAYSYPDTTVLTAAATPQKLNCQ